MKYKIIFPVIDEQSTIECLETIDDSIKKNIILVDNSESKFGEKLGIKDKHIFGENVGVPKAWNIGVDYILENGIDYLIILSATMRFHKGMLDFIQQLELNVNPFGLETQHGWHCIALSKRTFQMVGRFDENFYPAYYEDSDFIRRMELLGIHIPMSSIQRIPKIEIMAGSVGNAHAMRKSKINVNMGACRQYFIDKWGFEPRYDTQENRDLMYLHPFNDPKNPIDYCPETTLEELKDRYNLNEYSVIVQEDAYPGITINEAYQGDSFFEATKAFDAQNHKSERYKEVFIYKNNFEVRKSIQEPIEPEPVEETEKDKEDLEETGGES